MADLNQVYSPTVDQQDPDYIVAYKPALLGGRGDPIYLPEDVRQQIRDNNQNATATAQAVLVPFSGSTSDERAAWVLSTLQAVDNRIAFVKQRTEQLLTSLQQNDGSAYNASLKLFETGLALLPGIGSTISYISNQGTTEQAIDAVKIQNLIAGYTADLQQLAAIRAQLYKEYAGEAASNDPTDLAPKVIPTWYYYAGGAFLLLLLILYVRNRNQTGRNRR